MKRLSILALVLLAACAVTPEQRVRTALVDAGVPKSVAGCMAERMARKLSIAQLQELKRLAKVAEGESGEHAGPKRILRRMEALGDPEIVGVTSRAAIGCYIRG